MNYYFIESPFASIKVHTSENEALMVSTVRTLGREHDWPGMLEYKTGSRASILISYY
jgi:hypothetical protein